MRNGMRAKIPSSTKKTVPETESLVAMYSLIEYPCIGPSRASSAARRSATAKAHTEPAGPLGRHGKLYDQPPRNYDDDHEHDWKFHQLGYSHAHAWDNPQYANRSQHETHPEYDHEIKYACF